MKRKISLQEAHDLILESSAIIINNDILLYPSLDSISGDPENEWLYLSWDDGYHEFALKFIEEEQDIFFDGTTITMKDSEDDEVDLTLLVPMHKQ